MSGTDWFALIGGSIVMISFGCALLWRFQAARQRAPEHEHKGGVSQDGNALCMAKSWPVAKIIASFVRLE